MMAMVCLNRRKAQSCLIIKKQKDAFDDSLTSRGFFYVYRAARKQLREASWQNNIHIII